MILRAEADVLAKIPLGHVATIDDIAAAVIYLAAPASRMVTGTFFLLTAGGPRSDNAHAIGAWPGARYRRTAAGASQ